MAIIKYFTIMSFLLNKYIGKCTQNLNSRNKKPETKRNDFNINFR